MTIPTITPYELPNPSELPQSKVTWRPDARRAALLIHDMQRYFLSFYAAGEAPLRDVVENVVALRERCDAAGVPVIYSAQPADPERARRGLLNDMWGRGLLAHPELVDIDPRLAPRAHDLVLEKTRYNAFHRTELLGALRAAQRDQLWIVGVFAHIGCMLTAADAFMHDVKPFLVADAVADFNRADHDLALHYVARRCGVVTDTRALLAAFDAPEGLGFLRSTLADLLMLPAGEIPLDASLRELGLDSVRALSLLEEIEQRGFDLSSADLLEIDTLRALEQRVAHAPAPGAPS